jgi:hypothetical protein
MGWPTTFGPWPPTAGDKHLIQYYARFTQVHEAIRERQAALNNSAIWPFGSSTWAQGVVAQIQPSATPGRMTITSAEAVDWIDGSNIKRWINFSGIFNGSDLRPYAPGFYKVVLYQPDSFNHNFGDPNRGLVYDIIDNGENTLEILDDGQLTLNGLTLANYQGTGWQYQIIRSGSGTQRGYGWVERFPPKPNHPELEYGQVTAATTSTLTDARPDTSGGWRTPKKWSLNQWASKELVVQIGTEWKRIPISSNTENQLKFASQASAPVVFNEYWIIEPHSWWRPQFRLSLTEVQGRKGKYWTHNGRLRAWCPTTWYSGLREFAVVNTHDPQTDEYLSYGIHALTTTVMLSESPVEPCVEVQVPVFDVPDAGTPQIDYCGDEDHLFNPWVYWSIRGTQLAIEALIPRFVKPISYTGKKDIHIFDNAEWWKFHTAANTRTTTISSYSGGFLVSLSGMTMPEQTPKAGAWGSLECTYRVADADDRTLSDGTGTVTANSLILDEGWGPGGSDYVGKTIIISFGWSRRYPRRVKYIYPRYWFEPDENDDGDLVAPPDQDHMGSWQNLQPSTHYAEYEKTGNLTEDGPAFVTGESARYVAQNRDDGSGSDIPDQPLGNWTDASYMGLPNVGTGYPRWEGTARAGTAKTGGSFWLEDTDQLWWVGPNPLIVHTGTSTGGSATTLTDSTKSTNKFFTESMGGQRFVGMILDVRIHEGDGSPEDPPRWEFRPITAQSGTTLTVAIAFSETAAGKLYKIREPGTDGGHGAILNLWKGRRLRVVKQDGSRQGFAWITNSDDMRVYFDRDALGFNVEAGDNYEIQQIEAGAVLQRKAGPNAVNGWSLPQDATQDTRGANWHVGPNGPYENLPTVVKGYGRCRKFDYIGLWNFLDFYRGLNALVWYTRTTGWTSRADPAVAENNHKGPLSAFRQYFIQGRSLWGDQWDRADADYDDDSVVAPNEQDHSPPYAHSAGMVDPNVGSPINMERRYAYGTISGLPTLMNCTVDWWAKGHYDVFINANSDSDFDASGDPVLNDAWNKYDSTGPGNATSRHSIKFGSVNHPNRPPSPPGAEEDVWNSGRGYDVIDQFAIVRWDVAGGFHYTA